MMIKKMIACEYAWHFVGRPYIWGGDDPMRGYDCSGLVQEILASVGMDPKGDQSAQALFEFFLNVSEREMRGPGALVFYGSKAESLMSARISHVAFMIDDQHVIEAGGGGSKTLTEKDAIEQNAFVRIRPYNHRKDIVSILMPVYA